MSIHIYCIEKQYFIHMHTYKYSGILFSLKEERNYVTCDSMDEPGEHYVKWNNQAKKDKYCIMVSIVCRILKKKRKITNLVDCGNPFTTYVCLCVCIYVCVCVCVCVCIFWRRKWQPTPVFLPRESHGQRSLVGYSP